MISVLCAICLSDMYPCLISIWSIIPVCWLSHFCPICLSNSMLCLCLRNAYFCVTYVATYTCPVRCIVLSACDSRALVPVIYCSWCATCPAVPISTLLCTWFIWRVFAWYQISVLCAVSLSPDMYSRLIPEIDYSCALIVLLCSVCFIYYLCVVYTCALPISVWHICVLLAAY